MNWIVSSSRRLVHALTAPMDELRLDRLRAAALLGMHAHGHSTSLWFQLPR